MSDLSWVGPIAAVIIGLIFFGMWTQIGDAIIVEKKLKAKLTTIFQLFDAQNNGRISAEEIDLDAVPAEVLLVFKPLLVEMETYQEHLDQEEFIESSMALLQIVPV